MGLDCYWVWITQNPPDEETAKKVKFDPPLNLCGGMFSGHGEGSFRGKMYADFIESVTNYSLYNLVTLNQDVKEIAKKLRELKETLPEPELKKLCEEKEITLEEFYDLLRMFEVYADAGASIYSWY